MADLLTDIELKIQSYLPFIQLTIYKIMSNTNSDLDVQNLKRIAEDFFNIILKLDTEKHISKINKTNCINDINQIISAIDNTIQYITEKKNSASQKMYEDLKMQLKSANDEISRLSKKESELGKSINVINFEINELKKNKHESDSLPKKIPILQDPFDVFWT